MPKRSFAVIAIALFLDQLTKAAMLMLFSSGAPDVPQRIEVTPFFNLVLAKNRGVSFSMFSFSHEATPFILSGMALLIVIALSVWMWRETAPSVRACLALVIGGAAGNIIDRLRFGHVVDFLDFHMFGYHWPAFNLADSFICIGALLLVALIFVRERKEKKNANPSLPAA